MPKKLSKRDFASEDFVSKLLNDLKSQELVEQLRLECIADVKTKETYLQLKERIKNYVTHKMSAKEWTSNDSFREQVVECGVLALTVERVVDEVVSRKLQEHLRPIVIEMIYKYADKPTINKVRNFEYHAAKKRSADKPADPTVKAVQTICQDVLRDSGKIRADGLVAHSLATVSKLSDDEDQSESFQSDLTHHGDTSYEEEAKINYSNRVKSEPEELPIENASTSGFGRRERKLNPKYAAGMYLTSLPLLTSAPSIPLKTHPVSLSLPAPPCTSTPEKEPPAPVMTNGFHGVRKRGRPKGTFKRKPISRTDSEDEEDLPPPKREYTKHLTKNGTAPMPFIRESQTKASPVEDNSVNGLVRKSNRQRKVNSIIFWNDLPPNPAKGSQNGDATTELPLYCKPSSNLSITEDLESLMSEVQKKNSRNTDAMKAESEAQLSTKRYNSSDLYKPRFFSSSARMKKRDH